MTTMTTRERMKCMYEHREADRVPIWDWPWLSTLERWREEGLPEGTSYSDYFDLDSYVSIWADNTFKYPETILEETDEYIVEKTRWGATVKNWKKRGGVPEHIDFEIKDADSWKKAKGLMVAGRDRIDWSRLERNYTRWRNKGSWIGGHFNFGFDVTHASMVGTERLLVAMLEEPEWVKDMVDHQLEVCIELHDMIWDAGYHYDEIVWYDDMGYKNKQFFSVDLYRELIKPAHKRACEWAHRKGIKARLHSDGNILPFIPEFIEIGVDMLNPLEVKSGMEPVKIKKEFGKIIALHGGLNAALFSEPEKMWVEMKRVIPELKKNGGYVIASDHSIPETVDFKEFAEFIRLAKELGQY